MQTKDECKIELFEIELFGYLIVCKQMKNVSLNCKWYITILRDARGVMVIVVANEHNDKSSNPGRV